MDIATTTTTTAVKTPEAETETPTRIQPTKSLSFSNGVLKRHQPLNHHHHHPTAAAVVTYKECLKNHAASLGGHALDGCGEFMPSLTATSTDPTSLKCAACGCHRNFHRREPEEPSILLPPPNTTATLEYQPHHRHHPPPPPPPPPLPALHNSGAHSSPSSPSPPPISSSYYPSAPHMLLALSTGLSGPPQENINKNNLPAVNTNSNGRKRFRTKFTQDQKDKMLEFADKVGWKIQKRDEQLITNFCDEIGVDKGVLKVWMHNNKNTFGKRDQSNTTSTVVNGGVTAATETNNGNGISDDYGIHYHHQNHEINNNDKKNIEDHQNDHFGNNINNGESILVATNGNGSSSSS